MDTMLWNVKKLRKEKIRKKKQKIKEIKEDNSTDIDEQNIAKIINLKEFSKPMIDLPLLEKDDGNRQNFLGLIDRVIFKKNGI